jgi:HSP20 family protein
LEEVGRLIQSLQALQKVSHLMLSKTSLKELDVPMRFGPPWAWVDDLFRDGDWRRTFKIEEIHDGDTIVVRAELPGVDPEKDVVVEVIGDELVIRAQRSEVHRSHEHHVSRSEIRYGSFMRSIPVPSGVDESKIEATYKDGMLEVRMHSTAELSEKEARRVEIKRR